MKKLIVISQLLFSTVIFSSTSFAETWMCSYLFNGKSENLIRKRIGQIFVDPSSKNDSGWQIIFENDKQINLHKTFSPHFIDYFAILLNKQEKKFSMIAFEIEKPTDFIKGDCSIIK